MFAVDDGIWQGNFDFADFLFIAAAILALLAAVLYAVADRAVHTTNTAGTHTHTNRSLATWTPVLGWLAVACAALGWAVI